MPNTMSPRLKIGVPAGVVVAMAGVGAYLQASLGGPGTTAFVVRLLLVSLAVVGAVLLGLALRMPSSRIDAAHLVTPARQNRER
jgi:hypothetical protein